MSHFTAVKAIILKVLIRVQLDRLLHTWDLLQTNQERTVMA